MGVVKADLREDGREIDFERIGRWANGKQIFAVSGRLVYDVYVDSPLDGPATIATSPVLPRQGSWYVENGLVYVGVRVGKISPRFVGPDGKLFLWRATFPVEGRTSKTIRAGDDSASDAETPETEDGAETSTDDAVLLTFSASIATEDYSLPADLNGRFNVNSLGEWFADPIIYKSGVLELRYRREEFSNPLAKICDFHNATNSDAWGGFAPGTLKAEITYSAETRAESTSFDVDYKISWRPRGWNDVKANAGLYAKSGERVVRVTNADGSPTESPVLLAADGTRLPTGSEPLYLTFRTMFPKPFAALGLPSPFEI
ncbi:MAG: hypothetical protein IKW13_05815 [Thermoguttaceae bacterium]|nr:hypothetical protein [Thermoguttaceae bacterium]